MSNSGRGGPEYRGAGSARNELSLIINRLEAMILPGVIEEVHFEGCYAKVSMKGDAQGGKEGYNQEGIITDWLRWMTPVAGEDREWSPPKKGQGVIVLSPTGNINNGIIVGSFNTTESPPNCDLETIVRKTWAKGKDQSFFDFPFWELDKTKDATHEWGYLPKKGEFRREIGDKVVLHFTEDFLMFRIGNTQLVLTEDSAKLTSADSLDSPAYLSEIEVTPSHALIHSSQQASIKLSSSQSGTVNSIALQVAGKAAMFMSDDGVRLSYNKDLALAMTNGVVALESKSAKSQLKLGVGVSSLALDGVSVRLTPGKALMGMNGAAVIAQSGKIDLAATTAHIPLTELHIEEQHPTTVEPFGAGPPAQSVDYSEQVAPKQAPDRWELKESRGPFYPRTNKPKK